MASVYRPAMREDATRLYDIRRQSILELAPPTMAAPEAQAWAKRLTLSGMERKLQDLENMGCRIQWRRRRVGGYSRRHAGGPVYCARICGAGRRCRTAHLARSADARARVPVSAP